MPQLLCCPRGSFAKIFFAKLLKSLFLRKFTDTKFSIKHILSPIIVIMLTIAGRKFLELYTILWHTDLLSRGVWLKCLVSNVRLCWLMPELNNIISINNVNKLLIYIITIKGWASGEWKAQKRGIIRLLEIDRENSQLQWSQYWYNLRIYLF